MKNLLQFFAYEHLPEGLQKISKPFYEFARELSKILPVHPESTVCFRKLLEAKDCAVRARLFKWEMEIPEALKHDEPNNSTKNKGE